VTSTIYLVVWTLAYVRHGQDAIFRIIELSRRFVCRDCNESTRHGKTYAGLLLLMILARPARRLCWSWAWAVGLPRAACDDHDLVADSAAVHGHEGLVDLVHYVVGVPHLRNDERLDAPRKGRTGWSPTRW
jgi:hypothetical protein